MQQKMLDILHDSHLGKKNRARECMYWPGMAAQIKEKLKFHIVLSVQKSKIPILKNQ